MEAPDPAVDPSEQPPVSSPWCSRAGREERRDLLELTPTPRALFFLLEVPRHRYIMVCQSRVGAEPK
jgi:hypothetical protein